MNSPVISAESARELNDLAQTVDPILFWTCNYEPTRSFAISEDALFQTAVQDLYKFAIDTNCVLKGIALNGRSSICRNLLQNSDMRELKRVINTVQMLRSILDHNQSNLNGELASGTDREYRIWLQSNLNKECPNNEDDFAILNNRLYGMGSSLLRISRIAIELIRDRGDTGEIARKWKDATLSWYSTQTRQEQLYKSQLMQFYLAKASAHDVNFTNRCSSADLKRKIRGWIILQLTHCQDAELRTLEREREELSRALDITNPITKAFYAQAPKEYTAALKNIRSEYAAIEEKIASLQSEREDLVAQYGGNEIKYYFEPGRFRRQLDDSVRRLQSCGAAFTLLPQDLLYLDIEYNFDGVASPEGDFE